MNRATRSDDVSSMGSFEVLVLGEWFSLPRAISDQKAALAAVEMWDGIAPFLAHMAELRRDGLVRVRGTAR